MKNLDKPLSQSVFTQLNRVLFEIKIGTPSNRRLLVTGPQFKTLYSLSWNWNSSKVLPSLLSLYDIYHFDLYILYTLYGIAGCLEN